MLACTMSVLIAAVWGPKFTRMVADFEDLVADFDFSSIAKSEGFAAVGIYDIFSFAERLEFCSVSSCTM